MRFQKLWDSNSQNKTSEIPETALSEILGLWLQARAQARPGAKPGLGPSRAWKPGLGPGRTQARAGPGPKSGLVTSQAGLGPSRSASWGAAIVIWVDQGSLWQLKQMLLAQLGIPCRIRRRVIWGESGLALTVTDMECFAKNTRWLSEAQV